MGNVFWHFTGSFEGSTVYSDFLLSNKILIDVGEVSDVPGPMLEVL
jgi:hypothetical protein